MWATACPVVLTNFLNLTNQNINTSSSCNGDIVSYMLLEQINLSLFKYVLNINAFVSPDNLTCSMIAVKRNLPDYVPTFINAPTS